MCSFQFAGGDLEKKWFVDLTSSPTDRSRVVVLSSTYDGQDEDAGMLDTGLRNG